MVAVDPINSDTELCPLPDGVSPRVFGDRFRETRILKRGHSMETLYGVDLADGEPVVIKAVTADRIQPAVRIRLEHEADVLRKIDSPWLAPLLAVGQREGVFFVVTRYRSGTTLEALLRQRRLSVTETLAVARCLLAALAEAHRHAVLHRDIKSANVILEGTDPIERAMLVDFGLAHRSQLDVGIGEPSVDSVRYVSPEQAGMLDADVSTYSDLYSLGVVLYECLAGRTPFAGGSIGELLRRHMTQPPAELRNLNVDVPRALDDILQRLLRKDPRDRYQTAAAVLADVEALSGLLDSGQADPPLVVGLHDQRQTLTEPAFVGREQELGALDAQVRKARSGRGGLVLVEAESGGGKTRLLGELCRRWARQSVWVLRGQAQDQVGQHPFLALEGIADEILAACRADPQRAGEIREGLGDRLDAVVAVLPRLTEVLGGSPSQVLGPESFGEARTIEALVTFLASLGSDNRPALIILDDCQWADEPTLKLLRRVQSRRTIERHTPSYAVLICAFRSEEVREGHILRNLSPALQLRLPPFAAQDTRRLAESMAGSLPAEAMDFIVELSDGSPFMASAVLRGMVESKALLPEASGWRVERSAMDDVRSSRHAAGLLARRINLLPRVAIEFLKVAAVLGKEFEFELAVNLAGLLPGHAMIGLRQAQSRHLVWTRAGDEKCVFIHDKVRETCLALLTPGERRGFHLRAALLLEQRSPPSNFDLAYHYDLAGQSARALPYALAAADQARAQYSLEIAEQQYRIALRGSTVADQMTRYRIAEGLGDVLMLRGRYDAARQMFEAAKYLAEGDVPRIKAKIEGKLGELARKRGDNKTARYSLERALSFLQLPVPRNRWAFLRQLIKEAVIQILHTMFPKTFVSRRTVDALGPEVEAAKLYSTLAHVYWFAAGKIPCLWSHLRHLNLAERYAGPSELAEAYAEHGPVMSLVPFFGRAVRYLDESLRIRRELGDIWGQGQSLNYYGFVLYAAARLPECIDKCRQAVRLHERTGDFWQMHMARYQIAASLYRLGELPQAVDEARRLHLSGVELGDSQASGISLDIWAWASSGRLPPAPLQVELERKRDDAQATAQVLVAEAVRLLSLDEPQQAVEALERARHVAVAGGVGNAYVAPIWAWLATSLRRQIELVPHYTPGRHRELLRRMARAIREGMRLGRKFPNDLPHLLREKAMLMAMRGRTCAARRLLDKSVSVAEHFGFRYDRELAVQLRGRLGLELHWAGAAHDAADADAALRSLRSGAGDADDDSADSHATQTTVSLVEQFGTLLETGRRIASALSRDAVFLAVCDAASRLLHAEDCRIIMISSAPQAEGDVNLSPPSDLVAGREASLAPECSATGIPDVPLSGTPASPAKLDVQTVTDAAQHLLIQRALSDRETVIAGRDAAFSGEASESAGEGSELCTPVFERGRLTACFLVTHHHIANLFGDDQIRLADFIASIAGAALENAAGFADLQKLNETLEQRVAERTADLAARTEELARSNRDLEEFAYVASHDLQEPLRTVTGYCRLLEDRCGDHLDDKAREYVAQAVEAARRMRMLINDLLAYSRVGWPGAPFQRTDCNAALAQALRNLSVVIEETQTAVTCGPLPHVLGDATQLLQLFQNLIDNAIKFRSSDQIPQVEIAADRRAGEWVFAVRDNGIGMRAEDCDRVFTLFQRLHTRDEYAGTGIGLAVCKKTVERHGGRIWIESEVRKGSVVRFTIPAIEGLAGEDFGAQDDGSQPGID